ncbi:MAG TPA: hypothetical protein VGM07_11440 [Stellaceae bacterium]
MIRRVAIWLPLVLIAGLAGPAGAVTQTALPQFLPQPSPMPPPTPAPLAPPINPGYAAAPPNGLSPLLTQPGPLYELPQPTSPVYPPPQLPGPIDQQKIQAYRNGLIGQQWQLQRQSVSPGSAISRELQQQLNAPDPQ